MLVKLPKEVNKIMTTLQNEGFEVYVVGECVRDSVLGRNPFGWDLSTNAGIDDLERLFPEARVLSERLGVIRVEFIEEVLDKDGDAVGETGIIVDVSTYRNRGASAKALPGEAADCKTIEEDLTGRDFTINAIADSQNKYVDIFEGREDIRKKLIRTVTDAQVSFREEPLLMFKAIRLAAELGFDLHKSTYEAILNNHQLADTVNPEKLRDELTLMLSAEHAGKGLNMLMDTGLVSAILGKEVVESLTRREMQDLTTLGENIDKTKPVEERRLGLFFTCVDKKKARPAIERLKFDEKTEQHLIDAINDLPKLYFTATKPALKKFIYDRGWERYDYLANMEKAQRIIFEYFSDTKIKSKLFMLDEIKKYREPIFPEDLAIDANDLIEAGICTRDNADKMLSMLTEELHTHPRKNTREELLKLAKLYSKNKIAAMFRGIHLWK